MRRAVPIVIGVLVLLAGLSVFNLWRAAQEPVVSTPGPYEVGRQNLHNQLEDLKKSDAQIEQKAWNVIPTLRALIAVHQDRIAKFTGNSQAGEILAYEHDSVTRLEKRITDLEAQAAAQAAAAEQAAKDAAQQAAQEGKPAQK